MSQVTTTTIKATSGGNFTVPAKMRKAVGIEEGQSLVVSVSAKKKIIIEPIDLSYDDERISKSAEKARKNIKSGDIKRFETAKEAIEHLHNL